MYPERRINRSEIILDALGLQLASTARRAGFTSLVLAEGQGIPVACTGAESEIEEVVALAPRLSPDARMWQGRLRLERGCVQVSVMPVNTFDGPLFLCAAGGHGPEVASDLLQGALGICRILT